MINLLPSQNENKLMLNLIDESLRLFGIDVTLYDVNTINLYLDDRTLKSGVPYKILLQDYVDSRILANLKWSTVDLDKESFIAFMPIQLCGKKFSLQEFDVIRIYNGDLFQIREINKTYLVGLWYIVKLISYKPEANRPRETKEMKTNYLKVDKEEFE